MVKGKAEISACSLHLLPHSKYNRSCKDAERLSRFSN